MPPVIQKRPNAAHWYRCVLDIPESWHQTGRAYWFRIEKAGHYAAVYWNGHVVSEHSGQYCPVEADVTEFLKPGERNEIAVFVHDASGKYARPGIDISDHAQGNAYRGATIKEIDRNWTGIVGDITLCWSPAQRIADVFIIPSVRKQSLGTEVTVSGASSPGLKLRSVVLDSAKVVREFPDQTVGGDGVLRAEIDWADPVLWGPEPYGKPKLYVLRTELWQGGTLIDRKFTRFGFREIWIDGRTLLLNGKRLWISGVYFNKLGSIRYLNDTHSQSMTLSMMQASGLNLLHGHWDSLGEPWLSRCDEMGMPVMAGFFCDGRPDIQSSADPGWEDWMATACRQWARYVRNHPSILLWRPTDVLPDNLWEKHGETAAFYARMAQQVRLEDTTRPLADDSDVQSWAQGSLRDLTVPGVFDDGSRMAAKMAATDKPFLTKEIYTGFSDVTGLSGFLSTFNEKAYAGGGAGVIVQHIPLIEREHAFQVSWLSMSGTGNRNTGSEVEQENLPNWCDPQQPAWTPTAYSRLFAGFYAKYMKLAPSVRPGHARGELLISGLKANELALLVPLDAGVCAPFGVRAADDGTAWLNDVVPGEYKLYSGGGFTKIEVLAQKLASTPGYGSVQRIDAPGNLAEKQRI